MDRQNHQNLLESNLKRYAKNMAMKCQPFIRKEDYELCDSQITPFD
jgi:hypothetical protein